MIIIGAGLSGLIAANLLPDAHVIEAGERPKFGGHHKALLRFRTPEIGRATGIDFREVTVNKGIWSVEACAFVEPNISLANLYSRKVTGRVADRSIWNLEQCTRYIAPEDLYEQLLKRCADRVTWGQPVNSLNAEVDTGIKYKMFSGITISTMPMSDIATILHKSNIPEFKRAPIYVKRYRIDDCDVFQTVYFPSDKTGVYRASITGSLFIIESMSEIRPTDAALALAPFCLEPIKINHEVESTRQSFGKIAPIDNSWRRSFIRELSERHGIYSLGRFATWRNILLDDVLNDIYVIKKLIGTDGYMHARHFA